MPTNRWWVGDPSERYFLETTDRPDIGVDLKAPQTTDAGQQNHQAYALIKEVTPGDVVFHYHTPSSQIQYWSLVATPHFAEDILWGAHGVVARRAGVEPYWRPGWRVLLEGPYEVSPPVTRDELRERESEIRASFASLRAEHRGSLYLPFDLSDKRPLRPTQSYLTKAPAAWVQLFPQLAAVSGASQNSHRNETREAPRGSVTPVGQVYVPANEAAATSQREPFSVDPALVDRGLRGHARTQNALASSLGVPVRAPRSTEPQYDLAWQRGDVLYVAEVKSLTDDNEEKQLRLGLGQVLRYANLLGGRKSKVQPVLAVERQPRDSTWLELCADLGVSLVWAPDFAGLPKQTGDDVPAS